MQNDASINRLSNIDFLRIIAITCVVLCHATEAIYPFNLNFINSISWQSRIFVFTVFTIGRLGVPIFLFISGYFLLNKEYESSNIEKFWRTHLLPLLITTEVWIVIYDVFLAWFNNQHLNFPVMFRNIFFLERVRMGHMWYMSMILGVYLFIPFVARAIKNLNCRNIITPPFILSILYVMVIPVINEIIKTTKHTQIFNTLSLDFIGGAYGIMLIAGYFYSQNQNIKEVPTKLLCCLWLVSFGFVVWMQIYCFSNGNAYTVWYNAFPLIVSSACLAVVGLKIFDRFPKDKISIISKTAKLSFGVYLVHMPVLTIFKKYYLVDVILPLRVIILFAMTYITSFLIAMVLSNFKLIRRTLLYIK